MWHVSVSVWSDGRQVQVPAVAEKHAVQLLRGVGNDREWWWWNPEANIGHLRVGISGEEIEQMPCGIAEDDAGETGPERKRTR